MSRSTRLLQMMQLLRSSRPPVLAQFLAEELNVSLRTVYRDIEALRASGAIIDGEAGYGYALIEDTALPPMMFSIDEMEALILGAGEVREVGDPVLAAAAQSALAKLKAGVPERMRDQIEHGVLHAKRFRRRPDITIDVAELRRAAREERAVDIDYSDAEGRPSSRRIRPLSIVSMDEALNVLAWCQLRTDYRAFRVDRIATLSVTDESFRPRRVPMLKEFVERLRAEEEAMKKV